jgi:transcriptional regulator with GAF, ATPase, and Fis domain
VSENLNRSYRGVLRRLRSLRETLEQSEEKRQKDLTRSKPTQKLLTQLGESLELLERDFRELAPLVTQSRLADLATRLAVHFFVEKAMSRFCERTLDEIVAEAGAGTGAVVLFGATPAEARIVAARDAQGQSLSPEQVRISRTILARIVEGEDSILIEDALSDAALGRERSVQDLALRSVLAIPLRVQEYLAGAIYLENERLSGAFGEEERALLLGLGRLVTIYLSAFLRMDEEVAARRRIYDEIKGKTHFDGIVGSTPDFLQLLDTVAQVGPSDATVVVEGESGTGKELIARALHRSSRRAAKPMVTVNCAAIPETLMESELFGHEKGAFTGAFDRKFGRFEQADGSSLFLDEVGELSLAVQAKLLRFLQNREVTRLGGTRTFKIDVRLIAATSRDVQNMVKRGEFREDLFYRLYVVPIRVPPLRERVLDIPLLTDHFSRVFALASGRATPEIDPEVYDVFQRYAWPGNVRELENLMHRLVILCRGGSIQVADLPEHIQAAARARLEIEKNPFRKFLDQVPVNYKELLRQRKQMQEIANHYAQKLQDKFIDNILEKAGGNISRAAELSGIHRTLIHRNLAARGGPPRDQ